jgi:hypothetical protein
MAMLLARCGRCGLRRAQLPSVRTLRSSVFAVFMTSTFDW